MPAAQPPAMVPSETEARAETAVAAGDTGTNHADQPGRPLQAGESGEASGPANGSDEVEPAVPREDLPKAEAERRIPLSSVVAPAEAEQSAAETPAEDTLGQAHDVLAAHGARVKGGGPKRRGIRLKPDAADRKKTS
jgi:hypothetical protein